jgi:fructose-bisphosphate aldolase class 1
VRANAHALATICCHLPGAGIVPIVEPEVLMDGAHTIERCEEVTGGSCTPCSMHFSIRTSYSKDAIDAEHGDLG